MTKGITLPAIASPANLREGSWSWFNTERAIVGPDGKLYWSYAGGGPIQVRTGIRCYAPQRKFISEFMLRALIEDDHDLAGLLFIPSNRLFCGYSAHAGTTNYRRLATNALDVSAWSDEQTQTGDSQYDYSSPFYLAAEGTGDGRVYLFYRGGPAEGPTLRFITSDDLTATWSGVTDLFVNGNKPYMLQMQNGADRIDFCISRGHPTTEVLDNSLHHMYYEAGAGWHQSDGTAISTLPFDHTDLTPVINTAGQDYWQWDMHVDGSGNPIILYVHIVTPASDQLFRMARWNGSAWVHEDIAQSGGAINAGLESGRCGGGSIYDENTVYLSIKDGGGLFDLWRFTKSGGSWSGTKLTESAGNEDRNVLPVCPLNANSTIPVIWVNGPYLGFTDLAGCVYKVL